jgi:hypothetical protein
LLDLSVRLDEDVDLDGYAPEFPHCGYNSGCLFLRLRAGRLRVEAEHGAKRDSRRAAGASTKALRRLFE